MQTGRTTPEMQAAEAKTKQPEPVELLKLAIERIERMITNKRTPESIVEAIMLTSKDLSSKGIAAPQLIELIISDPNSEIFKFLSSSPKLFQDAKDLYQELLNQVAKQIYDVDRELTINLDCLTNIKTDHEAADSQKRISTYFNALSNAVANEILDEKTIDKRTLVMERWINVMKNLYDANDFSGALAVLNGLKATPILRLSETRSGISANASSIFEKIDSTIGRTMSNSQSYQLLLMKNMHSTDKPVIPYFGAYKGKLTFALDEARISPSIICSCISDLHQIQKTLAHVKSKDDKDESKRSMFNSDRIATLAGKYNEKERDNKSQELQPRPKDGEKQALKPSTIFSDKRLATIVSTTDQVTSNIYNENLLNILSLITRMGEYDDLQEVASRLSKVKDKIIGEASDVDTHIKDLIIFIEQSKSNNKLVKETKRILEQRLELYKNNSYYAAETKRSQTYFKELLDLQKKFHGLDALTKTACTIPLKTFKLMRDAIELRKEIETEKAAGKNITEREKVLAEMISKINARLSDLEKTIESEYAPPKELPKESIEILHIIEGLKTGEISFDDIVAARRAGPTSDLEKYMKSIYAYFLIQNDYVNNNDNPDASYSMFKSAITALFAQVSNSTSDIPFINDPDNPTLDKLIPGPLVAKRSLPSSPALSVRAEAPMPSAQMSATSTATSSAVAQEKQEPAPHKRMPLSSSSSITAPSPPPLRRPAASVGSTPDLLQELQRKQASRKEIDKPAAQSSTTSISTPPPRRPPPPPPANTSFVEGQTANPPVQTPLSSSSGSSITSEASTSLKSSNSDFLQELKNRQASRSISSSAPQVVSRSASSSSPPPRRPPAPPGQPPLSSSSASLTSSGSSGGSSPIAAPSNPPTPPARSRNPLSSSASSTLFANKNRGQDISESDLTPTKSNTSPKGGGGKL